MLPEVVAAIEHARSTLVFTNVRSATETWYQAILEARPDWAGLIALHHGSLEREVRDWVEDGLRDGRSEGRRLHVEPRPGRRLRARRPGAADRQPQRRRAPAAARGPQRPSPRRRSRASPSCRRRRSSWSKPPPRAARRRRGASSRARRSSTRRSTCSCSTSSPSRSATASTRRRCAGKCARRTHTRSLSDADWQWALDFVVHGGASLNAYPEYRRVVIGDDGVARVPDRAHRASPSHVDRHDRLRRVDHRAVPQRRPGSGTSRNRSSRRSRRATASYSPGACSSSCACAR